MSFREKSILAGILVLCLIVLLPIGYRFIQNEKEAQQSMDEVLVNAFLDLDESITEDRAKVKALCTNYNSKEFRTLCMKLPQKYLYKAEIIEEIAAYDYSRYGDYDLPDLFSFFVGLEHKAQQNTLIQEDAKNLLSLFDLWKSCNWDRVTAERFSQDLQIKEMIREMNSAIERYEMLEY